ncbi:MAG: FAD binding domain-containing protein [Anaerolineaceae bacterium]|jgi:carbon-monoxide dehydrogenase medium subunit|nr:FAD binding domain-containing protein [Anaerolineaceae bacterium]
MWREYINAVHIGEVLMALAEKGQSAKIVAGATDLIVEMESGAHAGVDVLVDVSRIPGLDEITLDEEDWIHLGPMVTHNHCVASKLIRERALPLLQAAWEVGSPQIRNRGTISGNLVTASPANDTISPLMALGAEVVLRSTAGERVVKLEKFYTGVRRTVLRPDEMLVDIRFPAMAENQHGMYLKFALRRAQAISLVNAAMVLTLDDGIVSDAFITLGSVATTIIHAEEAEKYLLGKSLTPEVMDQAARLSSRASKPIDDIRGSAAYRQEIVRVVTLRGLMAIAEGREDENIPENPVLLWGEKTAAPSTLERMTDHDASEPIVTTINGKRYTLNAGQDKTLLRLLREDAGLVGTKEGCAEGECGACTVILDGIAVMSCLVPAPRAHGAEIVTVEGLAKDGALSVLQQAFVDEAAVQCGYCTPGFLMSATKLLEERDRPTQDEIKQAITGNLCRCTGYYKIISAIELAAER